MGYDRLEWTLAPVFGILAMFFGPSPSLAVHSLYTVILFITGVVDLRHRYVYSIVSLPAILGAIILSPLAGGTTLQATISGFGLGMAIFGAFFFLGRRLYHGQEPIGRGDIEIAALAGAMVGFPRIISALVFGSVINAALIIVLLAMHRLGKRDYVPYGPGLCAGTLLAFFMPIPDVAEIV